MSKHIRPIPRGVTAVIAMLFLVLITTLAAVIYSVATTYTATVYNQVDADRARVCADNGIQWISQVFQSATMPKPKEGTISSTLAYTLWSSTGSSPAGCKSISQTIRDAATGTAIMAGDTAATPPNPSFITTGRILCDPQQGAFAVTVTQDASDGRILHITSTGYVGKARRTVTMDFWIDKGFDFAVWSSMGVQLGKNTVVEGNIAIPTRINSAEIVWGLSEFNYSKDVIQSNTTLKALDADITAFQALVTKYNAISNGNRISTSLMTAAELSQYPIQRNPGFVDEYDVFLKRFAVQNGDLPHQIPASTNILNLDSSVVAAIKNRVGPRYVGDAPRTGWTDALDANGKPTGYNNYNDAPAAMYSNATLDPNTGLYTYYAPSDISKSNPFSPTIGDYDQYAKVTGQVQLGVPLAGSGIALNGPVINLEGKAPIVENANIVSINPYTFTDAVTAMVSSMGTSSSQASPLSVSGGATQNGSISNKTITVADLLNGDYTVQVTDPGQTSLSKNGLYKISQVLLANQGRSAGSAQYSDMLARNGSGQITGNADPNTPTLAQTGTSLVATPTTLNHNFRPEYAPYTTTDMQASFTRPVFRNINFNNCTIPKGLNAVFENCTFTGVTSIQHGVTANDPANASNVRFQDCTVNGPLIGTTDTAATPIPNSFSSVWSNMWEFNGNATFDNQWKDSDGNTTVSIMAPQTYVNIGSNTDPTKSKVTMKGVCVAAMFDIRAAALFDGVMINCVSDSRGFYASTLGYFGTSGVGHGYGPNQFNNPPGGLGYIIFRQNKYRPLPYGISIPIRVLPDWTRYVEIPTPCN